MTPEKLIRLTTTVTLLTAFLLFASKLGVWYFSDSVSLMAAAVDNIGDFLASLIAFVAARYALKPADEQYRWGYTKAEPLASLSLGVFVLGAATFLIIESVAKIIGPTVVVTMPKLVIAVMVFSIVLTGALVLFQKWAMRYTESTIIHADHIHYKMDFMMNMAVIVTMLVQPFWSSFDPIVGLLIAAYIIHHTYGHIIKHSFEQLMDAELSEEDKERILAIVKNRQDVLGYHDLRTRRSGRARFIQIHLELNEDLDFTVAHQITDEVMIEIEKEFQLAEVIVHADPIKVE